MKGCLTVVGVSLFIYVLVFAWPISLLLFVCFIGWAMSLEEDKPLLKASRSVFLAAMLGLALVALIQLIIGDDPQLGNLVGIQDALVRARMEVRHLVKMPVWFSLCLLGALTAANFYMPKWDVVTRYTTVQSWMSRTYVALMVCTSFTFFGQVPLEQWAEKAHERNVVRYQAAFQREEEAHSRTLAAATLERSLQQLTPNQAARYRMIYMTLAHARSYPDDVKVQIAIDMAHSDSAAALAQLPVAQAVGAGTPSSATQDQLGQAADAAHVSEMPESGKEWDEQIVTATEAESLAKEAEELAEKKLVGVKAVFCKLCSLGVPELEGVVGAYVEEIVDKYAEAFFEAKVSSWLAHHPERKEVAQVAQQLSKDVSPDTKVSRILTATAPESLTDAKMAAGAVVAGRIAQTEIEVVARQAAKQIAGERAAAAAARQAEGIAAEDAAKGLIKILRVIPK